LRLWNERESTLQRRLRLINSNPLKERVHTPERYTTLSHRGAQFVICPQISIARDDSVNLAVYGCGQYWMIPGIAATRWHGSRLHPFAAKTQLLKQSLDILGVDSIAQAWTLPHIVQFINQRLAYYNRELVGLP